MDKGKASKGKAPASPRLHDHPDGPNPTTRVGEPVRYLGHLRREASTYTANAETETRKAKRTHRVIKFTP